MVATKANTLSYTRGQIHLDFNSVTANPTTRGYTSGAYSLSNTKSAYIPSGAILLTQKPAYLSGIRNLSHSLKAYISSSVYRSRFSGFLEGTLMSIPYIWIKTSDGTTRAKKFKVLSEGYDDGLIEKAENMERTIGGGIDYSAGAAYYSWNPIIRVRHTETETDYGNLADLQYFFLLNNPNAVPSNKLIFIDHHQVEHIVYMVGSFQKAIMGCMIDGEDAWYTVKIKLVKVN